MTCYSVQPRDQIFVKGYEFLPFPRDMGKNIGKNVSKNVSSKYGQNLLDHAKQSTKHAKQSALKTVSKKAIQKRAEATDDLIGNKIADRITKVSKT